ncbi:MAG TPA: dihydropteroate synthase, partial [Bacteroidota bacterium]|nr:dihydropteroate synthase [Bacteroidota bacterium]
MPTVTTNVGHYVFKFGNLEHDLSSRTHIVGILNITPDSFSDGGRHFGFDQAIRHAHRMAEEGADIIDIGGESSRPGSESVTEEEELRRVVPVIQRLTKELEIPLSIDTCKSRVAERALDAGASIVNDISGFTADPSMPTVVAKGRATAILMHMKGTPKTMQQNPTYDNVTLEVAQFLERQV